MVDKNQKKSSYQDKNVQGGSLLEQTRVDYTNTLSEISSDIHKALLKEQIAKDIDNGVLEYFTDDKLAPNGEINLFLKTKEGNEFLKNIGYTLEQKLKEGAKTHQNNSRFKIPSINRVAIYLLTLLSLQTNFSCSKKADGEKTQNDGFYVGTYASIVKDITIEEDKSIEKTLYKDAFIAFKKAEKRLNLLFPEDDISFHRFFPLMIKESRFHSEAKSPTGAIGYFQLKDDAITDVNRFLETKDMSARSPKSNSSDNVLYGVIHFMSIYNNLKTKYPDIKDLDSFVYATYNGGLSRISILIEHGKCRSRSDFVEYIQDLMDLSNSDKTKKISPYGVNIDNIFDKDYSNDETVIFDKGGPKLTKKKAQEIVNYVQNINAIGTEVDVSLENIDIYKTVVVQEGDTPFQLISKMIADKEIKFKDGSNIAEFVTDVLLDNGVNPGNIPPTDTLIITTQLMQDFDYLDTNTYTYDVVDYNKEKTYFLGKILEDKFNDKSFNENIVKNISALKDIEEEQDVKFYIKNMIIDFNTKNRKGWSTTTSKNVWIPTDVAYYNEIMEKKDERQEDKEEYRDNTEISDMGTNYTDQSLEKEGAEYIKYPSDEFNKTEKLFISIEGKKQEGKEVLPNPKYIILHSTGDAKDRDYDNLKVVSDVKAHFIVSKTGKVYKLTQNGKPRKLNHAGASTKVGATWRGNKEITYESVGIEVEACSGEQWNSNQYKSLKNLVFYLGQKYKIKKMNVLTHSQIASSTFGRGRKTDPYFVDRSKLGLPNNYKLIDLDVARGTIDPNKKAIVLELKRLGLSESEIKSCMQGLEAGIDLKKKRHK